MFWLLAALVAPGCHNEPETDYASASEPPTVRLIHPSVRNIVRVVGQPSFIESYERTSIYPKVTGFIQKWIVDIGDKVKKGEVLATLFVPETVEDFGTKKATVELDKERIELALKLVKVAEADVKAAEASLNEARAILGKYQAEVDRWDTEIKRLTIEVERGVVDRQILLESTNEWKSGIASRDAAKATIMKAEAELLSKEATLAKAKVDVSVARADLTVATSEARRLEAWVGYLTLTAPFDGVIVARNANTFDFVQPSTGDPTAMSRSPYQSPGGTAAPIYVVDRTDKVRIFIDIPAQDANYVHVGTKATVLAKDYRDEPIPGTVTRTSWALNVKSRTLRAEIDLPNPGGQILPGMYAYAEVIVERPASALCRWPPSPIAATRRPTGGTTTARRCGPKSRRASATANGSKSQTIAPRLPDGARRQGILDVDRRLGTGDPRRPVNPHRRRRRANRASDHFGHSGPHRVGPWR